MDFLITTPFLIHNTIIRASDVPSHGKIFRHKKNGWNSRNKELPKPNPCCFVFHWNSTRNSNLHLGIPDWSGKHFSGLDDECQCAHPYHPGTNLGGLRHATYPVSLADCAVRRLAQSVEHIFSSKSDWFLYAKGMALQEPREEYLNDAVARAFPNVKKRRAPRLQSKFIGSFRIIWFGPQQFSTFISSSPIYSFRTGFCLFIKVFCNFEFQDPGIYPLSLLSFDLSIRI